MKLLKGLAAYEVYAYATWFSSWA